MPRRGGEGRAFRIKMRSDLSPADAGGIERILIATGRFTTAEVQVALELVRENLVRGEESGYWFSLAELEQHLVGYACYGPIPCTESSYDLYWIAVDPAAQGRGIGRMLMETAEERIRRAGGTRVFIDTSSRADYSPTRQFYERCGYRREATLSDFYRESDDKVVYGKSLGRAGDDGESPR